MNCFATFLQRITPIPLPLPMLPKKPGGVSGVMKPTPPTFWRLQQIKLQAIQNLQTQLRRIILSKPLEKLGYKGRS